MVRNELTLLPSLDLNFVPDDYYEEFEIEVLNGYEDISQYNKSFLFNAGEYLPSIEQYYSISNVVEEFLETFTCIHVFGTNQIDEVLTCDDDFNILREAKSEFFELFMRDIARVLQYNKMSFENYSTLEIINSPLKEVW